MKIELKSIKVADLIDGYSNDANTGVKGFGGKLDIRPPYQREFRYDVKQQQAVVDTILKEFPLNTMYWSVCEDGNYEMIDGQQRTLSICEFFTHGFNIEDKDRGTLYFSTLTNKEKEKFLNYELTVYFCEGTDKEKLDWFRVINIAGEKLLDQELLNAVYTGPFVTDARRHFSKNGCPAYKLGADYLNGSAIEQAYLSTSSNGQLAMTILQKWMITWHNISLTQMLTSCGHTLYLSSHGYVLLFPNIVVK